MRSWLRRHEYVTATLALSAILAVWFWPLLAGDWLTQGHSLFGLFPWRGQPAPHAGLRSTGPDAAVDFYPILHVARGQIHAGQIPLWNPYSRGGMPLLGDMQSALLFPLTWIALVLPLGWAIGLACVLKLLIAGLGTYAAARNFGIRRAGALMAGAIYMLSAPLIVWMQWPLGTAFAIYPWLLLTSDRVLEKLDPRRLATLAAVVCLLVLAGHPESTLIGIAAAAIYVVVRCLFAAVRTAAWGGPLRTLAGWVGAILLGGIASAAALIPFEQAISGSIQRVQHVGAGVSLPLSAAIGFGMPTVYGNGKPLLYAGPLNSYTNYAMYFGAAALLLAAVGFWCYRSSPRAIALALSAAVLGAAVFGIPPVSWLAHNVWPFSSANLLRVYAWLALGGALGAGAAVNALMRRPADQVSIVAWTVGAIVVGALWLEIGTHYGDFVAPGHIRLFAFERFALFILLGGACLFMLGRVRPHFAVVAVLLVCLADLWLFQDWNIWLPAHSAYPRRPPSIAFLQSRTTPFRMATVRGGLTQDVLPPDTQAGYGIESLEGYDLPQSKRWANFAWFALGQRGLSLDHATGAPMTTGPPLVAARMMNTRYWMAAPGSQPPNPAFRIVYRGPDATVFEDPGALPRAYVVPSTREATDAEALGLLHAGQIDPRRVALVPPGSPAARGRGTMRTARILTDKPDRIEVHVPAGGPGWLALADAYWPTWHATVDGVPTKVRPTNYAALGVPLGRGAHRVVFTVSRSGFWAGAVLSALGWVCIALLALGLPVGRIARRRVRQA